jgi:hypothetical protein
MSGEVSLVRARAEVAVFRLLSEINEMDCPDDLRVQVTNCGRMAILSICDEGRVPKDPASGNTRTDCERDIIAWFLSAVPSGEKRRGDDIIKGMEKAGLAHGKTTVLNSLTRMVRLRLLRNDRDRLGYCLADNGGDRAGEEEEE